MSSWQPVKPTVDQSGGAIFRPEAYGVPDGVDSSVDMPLVQAAIDAAGAVNAAATVRLDGTYAVLESGDGPANVGKYTNTYYGVWCNYDDVIIDGNNTGSLVLEAIPTHTRYCMILVGDGGYQSGSWTNITDMLANGHICQRVKIKNLDINASILSDANMDDLASIANTFSANIGFAFCQNFEVNNVTIDKAFGNNGGIGMVATCRYYLIKDVTVDYYHKHAIFGDGAKSPEIDGLITSNSNSTNGGFGIVFATSGDYESFSADTYVHDCALMDCFDGIAVSGEGAIVQNNTISLQDINLTRMGVFAAPGYSASFDCDSHGSATITGNTIQRPIGATYAKGYGIYLNGVNVGFGGDPLEIHNCDIHDNVFNRLSYAYVLGVQTKNNTAYNTTRTDCALSADTSGGTASGNSIA